MGKEYTFSQPEDQIVKEPISIYHSCQSHVPQTISQEELDASCLTLQASKEKLIEKIRNHFHRE